MRSRQWGTPPQFYSFLKNEVRGQHSRCPYEASGFRRRLPGLDVIPYSHGHGVLPEQGLEQRPRLGRGGPFSGIPSPHCQHNGNLNNSLKIQIIFDSLDEATTFPENSLFHPHMKIP